MHFSEKIKPFLGVIAFSGLLFLCIKITELLSGIEFGNATAVLLLSGFAVISIIVLVIFYAGITKSREKSVFLTLTSFGVKMLLSFVFALVFFLLFKKQDLTSVILFFILYLGFTIFIVFLFRIALKKSVFKEKEV